MKGLVAHTHAVGRVWADWQELARHLVTEHGIGGLAGHLPVGYYVREHAIEHTAIELYEAHPAVDEVRRPWWTRPADEREKWIRMARDEQVSTELRERVEQHNELGRAMYERRRPDAPKTWLELSEEDRAEWILLAVDEAQRRTDRAAEALAIARQETGLTPPTEGFGANGYPAEHASNAAAAEPVDSRVPDLAEKLRRTWLSGKPFRLDEDGTHLDWTAFAHALVHDEGVRPR